LGGKSEVVKTWQVCSSRLLMQAVKAHLPGLP
jgi:hypothetical protein